MRHFIFFVLGAALLWIGESVYAHGGAFRGPNSGVPPGLRLPSDPEPPPPPPSDGPGPGPTTGDDDQGPAGGPLSGGSETGPSEGAPPQPIGPTPGGRKRRNSKQTSFDNWQFWWAYNSDDILNIKKHMRAQQVCR